MSDLKEQFSNKLEISKVISDPFDHMYIENFFKNEFYNDILNNIPDLSHFQKIVDTGVVGQNYSPERYIFSLKKDIENLETNKRKFWEKINEGFGSLEFWKAISLKFEGTLKERFSNLSKKEKDFFGTNQPKISIGTSLIKDFTKYQLGAHTDTISKIFSLLFYLPKDDNLKKIGTSLYEALDIIEEGKIDRHFTREATTKLFKKVKTCEFKRNSVFIFARTNYSFHGVEEVNINKSERNLLLVNFYGEKNNE